MFQEITKCRICGNEKLHPIIDLGEQALTGIFPRTAREKITVGPLELVKCHGKKGDGHCGLVQLRHSFDLNEMYGDNYGYRSSLNQTMVRHLREKVERLRRQIDPAEEDLILDIGSNDGTLLSFHPPGECTLAGIDPTAAKFRKYYRPDIELVTGFFSAAAVRERFGARQARLVTSIAMFYDIEDPLAFAREIASILHPDGIWHLEQSYLPSMLDSVAYDTICHEHLEYYGLAQIEWIAKRAGLRILEVELNDVNGGSFAVSLVPENSPRRGDDQGIAQLMKSEAGLQEIGPYQDFARQVFAHRDGLKAAVAGIMREGKSIYGYGASTKGNVILQFCGIGPGEIRAIAEVNEDKFGCVTPGTHIPIVSEAEARAGRPDYFLVLPWHFRASIVRREESYLKSGGALLFPLPSIEVVRG